MASQFTGSLSVQASEIHLLMVHETLSGILSRHAGALATIGGTALLAGESSYAIAASRQRCRETGKDCGPMGVNKMAG